MTRRLGAVVALAMLVGLSLAGAQSAAGFGVFGAHMNGTPGFVSISQDGSKVAFESQATNLSLDDSDTAFDVYVRDTQTGATQLVSRATGATGAKGNGEARYPSLSGNGRFVTFISKATNIDPDDTDTLYDVYVRDLQTETTILVSRATGTTGAKSTRDSFNPTMSDDGRYVAFGSTGNLSPSDLDMNGDIYVRDLQTDTTTLVSRATGVSGTKANQTSDQPAISGDGRYVAFGTFATNLNASDPPGDFVFDIYVRDLVNNTTTLVSRADGASGAKANGSSGSPSLSSDGHYLAFNTTATNLNAADTDTKNDVYLRDLQSNVNTLLSRASGAAGVKSNGESGTQIDRAISGDGHLVAFMSQANNLNPDDTETTADIYARDVTTNTTTLVSRGTGASGINSIAAAETFSISPDGRYVAFGSGGLDPSDPAPNGDVYVRDLQTNTTYSEGRGPPSYPRPKGASPIRASLVPAFRECAAPNRTHGAPLAFGSCNPPALASDYLTIGTPDSNGALLKAISHVTFDAILDNTSTLADEADIALDVKLNDVRRKSDIADYSGEVAVGAALRLTDKGNGPSAKEDGTMADTTLYFTIPCAATPSDSTAGSNCTTLTTAETLVPGLVTGGRRSVFALQQVSVYDGGADGDADTTGDNTLFMVQGVAVP